MIYPFTAITAQQQAQTALLLNCIMPTIGGVLLSGEKGTAKSTMVRSLSQLLPDVQVVNIPLSVTEDMLLGSICVEKAVQEGIVAFEPGLLSKAHGHILYIDEINLLSDSVLNIILDAAASGHCQIEREGISTSFPCRFILTGSMNPEEGALRPQILDRFGFFVELSSCNSLRDRVEIMKNRLAFEADSSLFLHKWEQSERAMSLKLSEAQHRLPRIKPSEDILTIVAQLCHQSFIAGHRGDIALLLGAMAHAALGGRTSVSRADVAAVQTMALAHRIRSTKAPEPQQPEEPEDGEQNGAEQENEQENEQNQNNAPDTDTDREQERAESEPDNSEAPAQSTQLSDCGSDDNPQDGDKEEIFEIGEFRLRNDILSPETDRRVRKSGSGKRCKTRSGVRRGRYVKARPATGKVTDFAFDASLRAAAPFQKIRDKGNCAVAITRADMHQKVRERRIGNTVLFLVDASSSMGMQRRMVQAKAAVADILKQSYIKRDTVALMSFRNQSVQLDLPFTRSVQRASSLLGNLKTGGKTPLAQALREAGELMCAQRRKDPEILPVVVLFSDGRATQAQRHSNPMAELQTTAEALSSNGIRFLVIDTECGFIRLGLSKKLAASLNAEYYHLDEIANDGMVAKIDKTAQTVRERRL